MTGIPPLKSALTCKSHFHSIPPTYIQLSSPLTDPELHVIQGEDTASSLPGRAAYIQALVPDQSNAAQ